MICRMNISVDLRIKFSRNYDECILWVEAFSSEFNLVWTNIVENAFAAMNGKGELTIRTTSIDGQVAVEICDSSPGIAESILSSIFDPFFATKQIGEGTGLGLNVAHDIIVQKHRSELAVESHPGRTWFQIHLPLRLSTPERPLRWVQCPMGPRQQPIEAADRPSGAHDMTFRPR
jgi:signal transduction histidine kinase